MIIPILASVYFVPKIFIANIQYLLTELQTQKKYFNFQLRMSIKPKRFQYKPAKRNFFLFKQHSL